VHELSVAQNIVDIIRQSVPNDELGAVRIVRLKLGTFSGVVADSLDFCFSVISSQTPLSKTHLEFEQVPFTVKCNSCQNSFSNEVGYVVCPECGSTETTVLCGRELQITEIELTDDGEKTS
jgi:hydrogenase nickel incorporation protein HypA/HybF